MNLQQKIFFFKQDHFLCTVQVTKAGQCVQLLANMAIGQSFLNKDQLF